MAGEGRDGPEGDRPAIRSRLLTVAEVASLMRVSTMTVYRLIKAGELASFRVGRSYRIPEEAVDRYLGNRYTEAG